MQLPKQVLLKTKLLDDTEADMLYALQSLDGRVLDIVRKALDNLDRAKGKLVNNADNRLLLIRLNRDITGLLKEKSYMSSVDKYLLSFDKADDYSAAIAKSMTGTDVAIQKLAGPARTAIVNLTATTLTSPSGIDAMVAQPIQRLLFKHVLGQVKLSTAKDELLNFMGGSGTGKMESYAGQIARDALFQYDGTIQKEIAAEIGLDGFFFVGGLQDNSRPGCIHMVNAPDDVEVPYGSGKNRKLVTEVNRFKDIVQPDGGFRIEDIPIIISRNSGDRGWNESTSEETYLANRNGYNCRHQAISYKLPVS